ncbi:MAG: hypothetical protein MUF73_06680 [Rhodobacteraceae bacterium]|nr:hypothetical protein [Paracoccaceae bacterium]
MSAMGELEDAVRALVRRHAFRSGRPDAASIAADFAVPLIAYHRDGIILYRSRDEIAQAVVTYFAVLQSSGVDRVEPTIQEIVPGGPDRLVATVEWMQLRADGSRLGANRSRIFFRRVGNPGTLQIELVEYLFVGSRSLFPERLAEARRQH